MSPDLEAAPCPKDETRDCICPLIFTFLAPLYCTYMISFDHSSSDCMVAILILGAVMYNPYYRHETRPRSGDKDTSS